MSSASFRDVLVGDVMNTDVVTLDPTDSVGHAVEVLLENDIGGAPVVTREGIVVGMLADADLVVRQGRLNLPGIFTLFFDDRSQFGLPPFGEVQLAMSKWLGSTVGEVMDPEPCICEEEDTIEDVATLMVELDLRRLPVVKQGQLVGIVARRDLLRLLLPSSEETGA
jgi:CBS domain-containing protein